MKKNKKYLLICLLFFVQLFMSATMVEKINYHTGEDFVQLFFKTNGIASIPDIFYPEKGNSKFLVMRVNDIEFKENKKLYNFNSPIIKNLRVTKKKNFYDIEIHLIEEVNYRVATNENGLLIEFPNIKKLIVADKTKTKKKNLNKLKLKVDDKVYSKNNRIKSFDVIESSDNNVKFRFNMTSNNVKHQVIEVNNKPYRLALDFINTKSVKLNKTINSFNVSKLRGAPNRANVFRVVFDLKSLEDFKVSSENKSLIVEFFKKSKEKLVVKNINKKKLNDDKIETKNLKILKDMSKHSTNKEIVLSTKTTKVLLLYTVVNQNIRDSQLV